MRADSPLRPLAVLCAFILAPSLLAQSHSAGLRPHAASVIVPQAGCFPLREGSGLRVASVDVGVAVLEQAATTTMDIHLTNPTPARLESELLVPVPEGAVVRGFTFQGASAEPRAELLAKDEARKAKDRALWTRTGLASVNQEVNYRRSPPRPASTRGTLTLSSSRGRGRRRVTSEGLATRMRSHGDLKSLCHRG